MINNNNITQIEFKVMVQALFDNQVKHPLGKPAPKGLVTPRGL